MKTTASFFSKHFAFSSLLMTALLLTACEDNAFDSLPPATQEGKNVMACLINGEPWQNDPGVFDPNVNASYNHKDRVLYINGFKDDLQRIFFELSGVDTPGTYLLRNRCNDNIDYMCVGYKVGDNIYYPTESGSGYLTITKLDVSSNDPMVAGTFAFDAVNASNFTDTLRISNGRFDIQI